LHAAERGVLIVGQFAMAHHQAGAMRRLAGWIAATSGCALNLLPHGANPVGAWLAGAVPHRGPAGLRKTGGMSKNGIINSSGKTWLLWDVEPDFDIENPSAALTALKAAEKVLAVAVFASDSLKQVADVILPLAPLAESEGSLVNLDGDTMGFAPAGKVAGEARPGWKILRRLGDELGLAGFGQVDLADLQTELQATLGAAAVADQAIDSPVEGGDVLSTPLDPGNALHRVGEVPMYSADALCRRAPALQQTVHAVSDFVGLNPVDAGRLGLADGGRANVRQGEAFTALEVRVSERVPVGAAWVRSATSSTRELGSATGAIIVEAA
jgi:NADH-quinone oxidoreductase subunit G